MGLALILSFFWKISSLAYPVDPPRYTPGIFRNPECLISLEKLATNREEKFRNIAIEEKKLKTEPEIKEFVERKKREAYLLERLDSAAEEMGISNRILNNVLLPLLLKFEAQLNDPVTKYQYKKQIKTQFFIHNSLKIEGKPVSEKAAFLWGVYQKKFPVSPNLAIQLQNIVDLRYGMALNRYLISKAFVEQPVTQEDRVITVHELNDFKKGQVYEKAQKELRNQISAFSEEDILFQTLPSKTAIPSEAEIKKILSLAERLRKSPEIPRTVQDEITQELDFLHKYNFPPGPFFTEFLKEVARYFNQTIDPTHN